MMSEEGDFQKLITPTPGGGIRHLEELQNDTLELLTSVTKCQVRALREGKTISILYWFPHWYSQVEVLLPDRVEVAVDGLGPLLGLAHLDRDVGVAGARLVLGLKALSTDHWRGEREPGKHSYQIIKRRYL